MAETGFARKKFSLFQAETKFDLVSAFPLMYGSETFWRDFKKEIRSGKMGGIFEKN